MNHGEGEASLSKKCHESDEFFLYHDKVSHPGHSRFINGHDETDPHVLFCEVWVLRTTAVF